MTIGSSAVKVAEDLFQRIEDLFEAVRIKSNVDYTSSFLLLKKEVADLTAINTELHGALQQAQARLANSQDAFENSIQSKVKKGAEDAIKPAIAGIPAPVVHHHYLPAVIAVIVALVLVFAGGLSLGGPLTDWTRYRGWSDWPKLSVDDQKALEWGRQFPTAEVRAAAEWGASTQGRYAKRFTDQNVANGGIEGIGRCKNGERSVQNQLEACRVTFWLVQ